MGGRRYDHYSRARGAIEAESPNDRMQTLEQPDLGNTSVGKRINQARWSLSRTPRCEVRLFYLAARAIVHDPEKGSLL